MDSKRFEELGTKHKEKKNQELYICSYRDELSSQGIQRAEQELPFENHIMQRKVQANSGLVHIPSCPL